jgi:serine/threonine-protein kinase
MSLTPGTRLGAYEITVRLGAGGMGEVYRARDTRLDRDVAIKVLPETFASDPERIARFQREAKTLALLNHPHIGAIYGLEESNGLKALVLELVEGPTLADRIAQGPISLDEALPIAKQIAEALETAHEHGIIHRDLKPANIKLKSDGTVKVLDFGLAKAVESSSVRPDLSASPTITSPAMTMGGVILGTAAYMSPEQARGKPADTRSDLWAFGCILYEMLTSKMAFEGEDVAEVLAHILTREPDWTRLPISTPIALRRLLRRALQKEKKNRLAHASDVRLELEDALKSPELEQKIDPPAGASRRPHLSTALITGMSSALVASVLVWFAAHSRPTVPTVMRLAVPLITPITVDSSMLEIALSPNGERIAYLGGPVQSQLYLRALNEDNPTAFDGTTGARSPFFSPDSEWIGYVQGQDLKKVSIHGGPPATICSKCAGGLRGASWSSQGTVVFSANGGDTGLLQVSAEGGATVELTKIDRANGEASHVWPELLPDGEAVIFTVFFRDATQAPQIALRDLRTGAQKTLIRGGRNARYLSAGLLVYGAGNDLYAARLDQSELVVTGSPRRVLDSIAVKGQIGPAVFSLSRGGSLLYLTGDAQTTSHTLLWVDRLGHEERIAAPPRAYVHARLSPDGERAALDVRDQENDIWIWDFSRNVLTRFTFDQGRDEAPAWTPDGRRLAFASSRFGGGKVDLFWQAADGTGTAEPIGTSASFASPYSFAPDGKMLVVREATSSSGSDLSVVPLGADRTRKPLLHTPFKEMNAEISPDGRWLAYDSDESQQSQVFVRPFPDVQMGRWQISTNGGSQPVWSRNGKELFYVDGLGRIVAVPIQPGIRLMTGSPSVIVEHPYAIVTGAIYRTYDVSPDGRRFLMISDRVATDGKPNVAQLNLVLNWSEELIRKFKETR